MDEPSQQNSPNFNSINMTKKDPNDKRPEYNFGLHCKEGPASDDPDVIKAWEERHRDKLLDEYCDTHPGSPECKVFDE